MKIMVINGPNLARLDIRDSSIYGDLNYAELKSLIETSASSAGMQADVRQSNDEATIISWLHEAADEKLPVIINPAAFTHYSYAIRDAAELLKAPLIEVHLSNPMAREEFRHTSVISGVATGTIAGFGKNGITLEIESQLWTVVEFQHVKPGKGPAFVRTKLKSVLTGKVIDRTFNSGVKIDIAILEKRDMQYLYKEGNDFVFMDSKTYDQMTISAAVVGDMSKYMLENTDAVVAVNEGNPLYIELAASVPLRITYTEPGIQGDRSSGGTKPATVETGIEIQVPLFIKQDEIVMVDTRDGSYQGRAN